jgi:2-dehydro-3-deoxy-D-arabinonate dehydratase
MQLAKYRDEQGIARVGLVEGALLRPLLTREGQPATLSALLEETEERGRLTPHYDATAAPTLRDQAILLAPIDRQEVWGAGVTYLRSKEAREGESEHAGSCYDQVYQADRPELFFKATPHRVVGPGKPIRVRNDSSWTVPEPELALVITSDMRLAGFTIGNDVSARDIEGRNPLYLPQAKVYQACCALGPVVTLAADFPPLNLVEIRMIIRRHSELLFEGATSVGRMIRTVDELIGWLGRDNAFPYGVVLLTGTGIVPPDDVGLCDGDVVEIECTGIGRLVNPVVQSARPTTETQAAP